MSRFVRLLVPLLALVATLAAPAAPLLAQSQPVADISAQAQTSDDPRFFSQTSFRIDNDAFWDFFQKRGGVRTFGYPVSRQFQLLGFPVQIFQRIVMQQKPDGSVATMNLLDAGIMPYTRINGSTFPAPDPALTNATPLASDPNYADAIVAFIQTNAPDTFNGQPVNFFQTFQNTVTLQDAYPDGSGDPNLLPLLNLELWGAPTSAPQADPTNNNFIYQRFQRGIMHFDAGCQCTQGLLLADYLKSIITGKNLPPDLDQEAKGSKFYHQYDSTKPGWLARPADLPGSDLTNAFETQQPGQAAAPPAGQPAPQPAGPTFAYGFQVHMWDASQDGKTLIENLTKGAGMNWLKQQVNWIAVETAPGQYDWSQLDAIVNTASSQGTKILISVDQAPTFYRGPNSGLAPTDPSTFGNFMQAMAARYAGKIQAYELWNEENLDREMGTGNIDPSNYLPLLKAGYQGVKVGDPNALALLGAPSPTGANIPGVSMDDVSYLQQLYALNGGEAKLYFDAMGAHPSGFAIPPDCTPDTPQCSLAPGWNNDPSFFAFYRVNQYHDVMTQNGDSGKKIWFTEFGYDSTDQPPPGYEYAKYVTEQNQADFLVRAFKKARALDYVGGMFIWNLNFQPFVPKTDEKWGFGLVRPDWSPRPAYTALQQMPKT